MTAPLDAEVRATQSILRALAPLTPLKRQRVIGYIVARNTHTDAFSLPPFKETMLDAPIAKLEAVS